MAYLDNSSITVDAVLTKKGREILSKGANLFKITRFALSDDEIDYSLWNPLHPSGSDYYGKVIENMPVMEALIDETQTMRYKLISIDEVLTTATSVNLPYIQVDAPTLGGGSVTDGQTVTIKLQESLKEVIFTPITNYVIDGFPQSGELDGIGNTGNFGYTFIINKSANDIINESKGMFTNTNTQFFGVDSGLITSTTQAFSGDGDFTAITRVGTGLQIIVNSVGKMTENTVFTLPISVIGNQSGATFNMVLSFIVPDSKVQYIGTGIDVGGAKYAAYSGTPQA